MRETLRLGAGFRWVLLWAALGGLAAQATESVPPCSILAGTVPHPERPVGTRDPANPIEHVVVVMEENHSFDNVLGSLSEPRFYGDQVDGIGSRVFNLDSRGQVVRPFHLAKDCVRDMDHKWEGSHFDWNNGLNDGFVSRNDSKGDGYRVMGYYDERDYPLMYFIADHYAVGDRFFSSVMTNTIPNRSYLYSATSRGRINNRLPNLLKGGFKQKTIFEALNEAHVSWTYYVTDYSDVMVFSGMWYRNRHHFKSIRHLSKDAQYDRLPQVVFIENSTILGDEHPPFSAQISQSALARHLQAVVNSPA